MNNDIPYFACWFGPVDYIHYLLLDKWTVAELSFIFQEAVKSGGQRII